MIIKSPPPITSSLVPSIQVDGAADEADAIQSTTAAALHACIQRATRFSGIPESHMALLQRIAVEHNSIIAIRPVDRHNTMLLLADYPTKGLQIKGKSANWGPQYGFICVDQRFSKLRAGDPEKIRKANESVQDCLRDGHAESIDLHLTPDRLGYLIHEGLFVKEGNGERFNLRAEPARPDDPKFGAERLPNGDFRILVDAKPLQVLAPPLLEGAAQQGFKQKPLTADYDLLAVMPEWSQFSGQNIRRPSSPAPSGGLSPVARAAMLPTRRSSDALPAPERRQSTASVLSPGYFARPGLEEEDAISPLSLASLPQRTPSVTSLASLFKQRALAQTTPRSPDFNPTAAPRRETSPTALGLPTLRRSSSISSLIEHFEDRPDPQSAALSGPVDNVSEHEKHIAHSINSQLRADSNSSEKTGYDSAWQLVHHGSDEGNPVSDEADNYPASVFLPTSLGDFQPVDTLKNPSDLARLVRNAIGDVYHFEGNKHWPMARQEGSVARRVSELERRLSVGSINLDSGSST